MAAIIVGLTYVFIVLRVTGFGLTGLFWATVGFALILGLGVLYASRKETAESITEEGEDDVARMSNDRKRFSLRKMWFVKAPSRVDRDTHGH